MDSSSVNNDPTAAGEDCILASLERPINYRFYYISKAYNYLYTLELALCGVGTLFLSCSGKREIQFAIDRILKPLQLHLLCLPFPRVYITCVRCSLVTVIL